MRKFGAALSLFVLCALVLVAPSGSVGAQEATPEEQAAAIVRPAVVYIEMEWSAWVRVPRNSELFFVGYVNGGNPFTWGTRCSGFIVSPIGYVVTAGHCVDTGELGARGTALEFATQWLIDDGWAFQRDFDFWLNEGHLIWGVEGEERGSPPDLTVYVQRGVAAGGLRTGEAFPARVVDFQSIDQGDIALLKIEESDLPAVLVAPAEEIQIGTDVLSVGYPGSSDLVTDATYEPTFKDGQVNSKKTREGGLLPVYEISAALSGGMSGGPTVNLDGDVLGVNSFSIVGETEAFNFISPSSLVQEVLARNGVSNELGPIDEAYREGLAAYFSGDYRTALQKFDEVLAVSPTHQQAQEFSVEASKRAASQPEPEAAGEAEGGGGGFPAWVITVIAAGVVGVALALVASARRRRPAAVMAGTPAAPSAELPAAEPTTPPRTVGFQPETAPTPPAAPPERAPAPAADAGGPSPPAAKFCSNCGQAITAGARFCLNCGHEVWA